MRERQDRHDRGLGDPVVAPGEVQAERDVRLADERGAPRGDQPAADTQGPLFTPDEMELLRHRWESVQAAFVDEPRRAVAEADSLVEEVMERLTHGFADQRERLEQEWGDRDEVSTEDLRMALRHYRSFFDRLLRL